MAQAKRKEIEPLGVYHAAPRSFERNEQDLIYLKDTAPTEAEAQAHDRRLTKLRARERAKVRIPPTAREKPARKLPRKDPLAKLSERYFRIAELLRDHAEGVSIGRQGELIGFVQGGKTVMTQPEAFANKSRRGRIAWERFIQGCVDCSCDETGRECVKVVLQRKSFTACLADLGIAPSRKPSTRQVDKFVAVLATGLDDAGAYLGVN